MLGGLQCVIVCYDHGKARPHRPVDDSTGKGSTMALISQETVRRIKDEVRVSDVLEWLDAHVVGTNKAFCPLCADKDSRHPGMSFDDGRGMWHCFVHDGGGDVITLVQECYGVSFTEAVELMATRFGIEVKYDEDDVTGEERTRNASMLSALGDAQGMFIGQRESSAFATFVRERHLTQAALDRFGIGMSCAGWAEAVVKRLSDRYDADVLVGCGLCTKGDDGRLLLRYRDRVTFPIRNASGTIVGFGGRDTTGRARGKYINTNETPLFHKRDVLYGLDTARRAMSKSRSVIVCEGYMDVVALQTHGFENAVGAMGTAVTEGNLRHLARSVDIVYLCLDSDEAGRRSATRVASKMPVGYTPSVLVVTLPRKVSKDPDEWFNRAGMDAKSFQERLDMAVPLYLFCVRGAVSADVRRILAMTRGDVPTDRARLAELRRAVMDEADKVIVPNADRIGHDEMVSIADWLVRMTGVPESAETVMARWVGGGRRMSRDKATDDASGNGVTRTSPSAEDLLLYAAYERRDDASDVLTSILDTEFGEHIDAMTTSPARRSLLYKEMGCADRDALWDVLEPCERDELTRVIAVSGGSLPHPLPRTRVREIAWEAMALAMRRLVHDAERSPTPDFTSLIRLRQRLAKAEAKAKGNGDPTR